MHFTLNYLFVLTIVSAFYVRASEIPTDKHSNVSQVNLGTTSETSANDTTSDNMVRDAAIVATERRYRRTDDVRIRSQSHNYIDERRTRNKYYMMPYEPEN